MKSRQYPKTFAEYVRRFRDQPPSILTDEAALRLIEEAIQRAMAITELDLAPAGSPPSLHRRDEAA
jgi:hypothetical protein